MATRLRVCCPCGEQDIDPPLLTVQICDTDPAFSYYEFPCDVCGYVRRPASPSVIYVLRDVGVGWAHFTVPLEVVEPHTGPQLTAEDLTGSPFDWDAIVGDVA